MKIVYKIEIQMKKKLEKKILILICENFAALLNLSK